MYNVCVIDNEFNSPCIDIGVDETLPINKYAIQKALESDKWADAELKSLISNLSMKEDFSLKAYSNPDFFQKDYDYIPDIVIFDWDYGTKEEQPERYLENILSNYYCIVFIYTSYDKKEEITSIITGPGFQKFANRIEYYEKENSTLAEINDKIDNLKNTSFSFAFGKKIRQESVKSVENILVDLGKIDIEKAQKILNVSGSNYRDLIEFIGERFKNLLPSIDFSGLVLASEETKEEQSVDEQSESQDVDVQSDLNDLWKYRLYFTSRDKVVRKGDIIKWDSDYYLVLTPDCDLSRFWNKTLGYLNIVPLLDAERDKIDIKKLLSLTRDINSHFRSKINITSLSNGLSIACSSLILPFIDNTSFFLFPKMISSRKIEMPAEILGEEKKTRKDVALNYEMLENVTKITTLSEPFLTAVVEHIFTGIKGYGCPDYDDDTMKELTQNAKGVFKSDS